MKRSCLDCPGTALGQMHHVIQILSEICGGNRKGKTLISAGNIRTIHGFCRFRILFRIRIGHFADIQLVIISCLGNHGHRRGIALDGEAALPFKIQAVGIAYRISRSVKIINTVCRSIGISGQVGNADKQVSRIRKPAVCGSRCHRNIHALLFCRNRKGKGCQTGFRRIASTDHRCFIGICLNPEVETVILFSGHIQGYDHGITL